MEKYENYLPKVLTANSEKTILVIIIMLNKLTEFMVHMDELEVFPKES